MEMEQDESDDGMASALANPDAHLDRIRRYEVTIERSYHRALDQLRKLQKDRRAVEREANSAPAAPANGFVSQDDDPITPLAFPGARFVSHEPLDKAIAELAALYDEDPPAAA
jgi:hypothetical protein